MTRNLYLGADLTPAIGAPSLDGFVAANGQILREVDREQLPGPGQGPGAARSSPKKPDLVGLQEVALWRTGPPSLTPVLDRRPDGDHGPLRLPAAELLTQLNKGKNRYEVVVVQPEFDFEAPADENGVAGDGPQRRRSPTPRSTAG